MKSYQYARLLCKPGLIRPRPMGSYMDKLLQSPTNFTDAAKREIRNKVEISDKTRMATYRAINQTLTV